MQDNIKLYFRGSGGREVFPFGGENESTLAPRLIGGIGEKDFGSQFRQGNRVYDSKAIAMCLNAQPVGNAGGNSYLYEVVVPVLTPDRAEKRQNGRRFKEDGDPSFTLTAQDKHGIMLTRHKITRATDLSHCLMARDYKGIGNQEMAGVLEIKEATKKGYAEATPGDSVNYSIPTSTTRRGRVGQGIANTLDTGCQQGVVTEELRIRKLTPRECWRLQGFPDWAFDKAQEVNSDSQLYKQAGNSVTVNVIHEIAKRLEPIP